MEILTRCKNFGRLCIHRKRFANFLRKADDPATDDGFLVVFSARDRITFSRGVGFFSVPVAYLSELCVI